MCIEYAIFSESGRYQGGGYNCGYPSEERALMRIYKDLLRNLEAGIEPISNGDVVLLHGVDAWYMRMVFSEADTDSITPSYLEKLFESLHG